ncbi:hypothetical protein P154DRAFT_94892 [Amniculicola lignicola CBS 123094]|uniref:PLC-like phosphodiesterase n=1 Tax=Amniculicola lignicola CBS 123094 TaxID=1392246 RepID=A0A6A5WRG8_9PLEO|nr:hypothetical protein P154DRAFT_94892 [Amniculicola lignicola CBS 123094]
MFTMYTRILFALALGTFATGRSANLPSASGRACNNSPLLCSKPYDTVTYLGAHDSPYLRDESTTFSSFGNQFFSTTVQLDAGVRMLQGQIHASSNKDTGQRELHLCHTSCDLFDAGSLKDWLLEVRKWMDSNPNEVITILLVNNGIKAKELEDVYSQADVARYGYVPPKIDTPPPPSNETETTWPTLDEMINRNERLVSFISPLVPDAQNAPYLLDQWTFMWENPYLVTNPSNFTCLPDRPEDLPLQEAKESGRLFMMNHFLYWQQAFGIQVPDIRFVNVTNAWEGPGSLGEHLMTCSGMVQRQPTFVLVDFFNVGPAIKAVDIFNKVDVPVGRKNVTSNVVPGGAGMFWGAARRSAEVSIWGVGFAVLAAVVLSMVL